MTKKSEFSSCGKLGKLDQRHAEVLADKPVGKGEIALEPGWSQIIRVATFRVLSSLERGA